MRPVKTKMLNRVRLRDWLRKGESLNRGSVGRNTLKKIKGVNLHEEERDLMVL